MAVKKLDAHLRRMPFAMMSSDALASSFAIFWYLLVFLSIFWHLLLVSFAIFWCLYPSVSSDKIRLLYSRISINVVRLTSYTNLCNP